MNRVIDAGPVFGKIKRAPIGVFLLMDKTVEDRLVSGLVCRGL